MKIFEIREDGSRKKVPYIDAAHKWGLPGVRCPICNSWWSTVGLEYPSVDLTNFPEEKLYREARSESLSEFLKLKQKIANAFPQLTMLKPGAEFGPSVGKAIGKRFDGFVWRAWWTICLEANALEKLKGNALSLPNSVKAELRFKKEEQEIFEFDLPLKGKLTNGIYDDIQSKYCNTCGRDSASKPDEILIEHLSLPTDIDIFRVSNFTTIILVTDKFVETVTNLGIKGAIFNEVKTI
jgi:uncharacterized double-CXXCG motif protein